MKKITPLVLAAIMLATGAQAQPYQLIYDPADGSLTIDTNGGDLYGFGIYGNVVNNGPNNGPSLFSTDANLFATASTSTGPFNIAVYTGDQIPGNQLLGASDDALLQGFNIFGWLPFPTTNLGPVLPPNLTNAQYQDLIDRTEISTELIPPTPNPNAPANTETNRFELVGGVPVPEPSSLALLTAASLLVARRRRRDA